MQVIEGEKDPAFVAEIIKMLMHRQLDDVVAEPAVAQRLEPILKQHWETVETIKQRASSNRGVVTFDLVGTGIEGYNKFIPYYFHPETTYVVSISQSAFRTKISVGSNPWAPRPRTHNIAEICERYGGGGHAVVGAISLKPEDVELGRKYMTEIVDLLRFED